MGKARSEHPGNHWRRLVRMLPVALVMVTLIDMGLMFLSGVTFPRFGFDTVTQIRNWFSYSPKINMAFVDIDDAAFGEWGKPGTTDRAKIADLIEHIAQSGPAAIVVDVDLSQPRSANDAGDKALQEYLSRDYTRRHGRDAPPIILARALQPPDPHANHGLQPVQSQVLKDLPDDVPVHWASAGFVRTRDGVVRSWRLAEPICDPDEGWTWFPSIELLAWAAANDVDLARLKLKLKRLFPDAGPSQGRCLTVGPSKPGLLPLGGRRFTLWPQPFKKDWIAYSIPWRPPSAETTSNDGGATANRGRAAYFGALDFLRHPEALPGYVVVIGGSNAAGRDSYVTPIGQMPGAMVLINAIDSLQRQGQLEDMRYWPELGLSVVLGMLVWLALKLLRLDLGFVVAIGVFALAVLVSLPLIGLGLWFNPLAPVAGAMAHLLQELGGDIWRERRYGMRVLLASEWRGEK